MHIKITNTTIIGSALKKCVLFKYLYQSLRYCYFQFHLCRLSTYLIERCEIQCSDFMHRRTALTCNAFFFVLSMVGSSGGPLRGRGGKLVVKSFHVFSCEVFTGAGVKAHWPNK